MTNPTEQFQQLYVVDGFAVLATSEENAVKVHQEFLQGPASDALHEAMKPALDFIDFKQREIDYKLDQEINSRTGE